LEAPRVELDLVRVMRVGCRVALLCYAAVPGQKALLLRSDDGVHWRGMHTALARGRAVYFLVYPPPGPNGPAYRAVVVDYICR
jgi:hypothetical protein